MSCSTCTKSTKDTCCYCSSNMCKEHTFQSIYYDSVDQYGIDYNYICKKCKDEEKPEKEKREKNRVAMWKVLNKSDNREAHDDERNEEKIKWELECQACHLGVCEICK